jgi:hypothetical protein
VSAAITHILAPVEPAGALPLGPRLAMQLASGSGALVTLLYVEPQAAALPRRDQLDALTHLHDVTGLAPQSAAFAPVHAGEPPGPVIRKLRAYREELAALAPDNVEIRLAWRRGDLLDETLAFIDEAGVDVVVIDAPERRASAAIRWLQVELLRRRPCHVLTAHSPRAAAAAEPCMESAGRWRRLVERWRRALRRHWSGSTSPVSGR